MNKRVKIALMGVFLLLAIAFFFVRDCNCEWLVCRRFVAIPTLFAMVAATLNLKRGGWLIPLALLASAAGDWAGSMREFIMQIAFFALAHIFYISDFAPKCKFSKKRLLPLIAFSAVVLPFLGYVLTHIELREELIAVGIYGVIIYSMGFTTLQQNRPYSWLYAIAAVLFIFSDSCIAYNRFVGHLPHANTIIMVTYYAAQGIFCALQLARTEKR
ncbi:MAG: lysoplasmalogenase [Alistipes sp.]|nr:lysoplasmalogenase [Alistipes sp.]